MILTAILTVGGVGMIAAGIATITFSTNITSKGQQ